MIEGIILKGIGGFYYVDTAEGLIECKARGRFRKTVGKPIVGDRVTLEIQPEDGTGYLQTIAPRKNSLIRPAVGESGSGRCRGERGTAGDRPVPDRQGNGDRGAQEHGRTGRHQQDGRESG